MIRMTHEIDFNRVLLNYSGRSLEKARVAMDLLLRSQVNGGWEKGASRSVPAALGKMNVAKKAVDKWITDMSRKSHPKTKKEQSAYYCIYFGQLSDLLRVEFDGTELPAEVEGIVKDFLPVARLIRDLNATRPLPVITFLNSSRTVTKTWLQLSAVRVEMCEIRYEKKEKVDPETGKKSFYWVGHLLWPEGTQHGTSPFNISVAGNNQCQACGHAIRNAFNWVPLVIWGYDRRPKSLWVGKDCSKTLFGIKVDGELELEVGEKPQ